MRKIYLLLIALFVFSISYSQEVYFLTGSNITTYHFSSEQGSMTTPLYSGTGIMYEMGYIRPLINKRFSHTIGVNLNEYNAVAGDFVNSYKWNTKYLGVNNSINFMVPITTNFKLDIKAGINLSTIVYGRQEINGAFFDLKDQDEFSGLNFMPYTGLHLKYKINDLGYFSFGYGLSRSLILFNISQEKLTTSTNQILFGIHFNINKK
jgi:hypothetical protein